MLLSEPGTTFYYLPAPFAFSGNRRWLIFWDIFYYRLYSWQGPTFVPPAQLSAKLSGKKLAAFDLSTMEFSRLYAGLPLGSCLTLADFETGRKAFGELCRQAQAAGLLYQMHEDDDPYLNTAGAQAQHRFWLPLHQEGPFELLARPFSYVEKGWAAQVGNKWERYLLNLFSLRPELATNQAPAVLRGELESWLQHLQQQVEQQALGLPEALPQKVEVRQVAQASQSLLARHLISAIPGKVFQSAIFDQAVFHQERPGGRVAGSGLPPKIGPEMEARLLRYANRDKVRAERLRQLAETGWLELADLRAAWPSLPDFYAPADFALLLDRLKQREQVASQGRHLSWQEVEGMARQLRSRQGQRSSGRVAYKGFLKYQATGLIFRGRAVDEGNWRVRKAFRPGLDLATQGWRVSRVKLEVRVRVAGWRGFGALSLAARPPLEQVRVRLLDGQRRVIFEDVPQLVDSTQAMFSWSVSLEAFLSGKWSEYDTRLFYFEIEREPVVGRKESEASWFATSVYLRLYGRGGAAKVLVEPGKV